MIPKNKKTSALIIAVTMLLLVGNQVTEPTDHVGLVLLGGWLLITMVLVELTDRSVCRQRSRVIAMRIIVLASFSGMLLSIIAPSWIDGMAWICACTIPLAWVVWELTKGD